MIISYHTKLGSNKIFVVVRLYCSTTSFCAIRRVETGLAIRLGQAVGVVLFVVKRRNAFCRGLVIDGSSER